MLIIQKIFIIINIVLLVLPLYDWQQKKDKKQIKNSLQRIPLIFLIRKQRNNFVISSQLNWSYLPWNDFFFFYIWTCLILSKKLNIFSPLFFIATHLKDFPFFRQFVRLEKYWFSMVFIIS